MLSTRLWMGAILIILASGMLVFDQSFRPWYPFLLLFFLVLALVGCLELVSLLPEAQRPPLGLCLAGVVAVVLANWPAHVGLWAGDPWRDLTGVFAALVLAAFLAEMATFREPGGSVTRIALAVWVVAYLGLLPSFLAQLRWQPGETGDDRRGVTALALAIFVPKFCDIGAYFTGRLLGRHRMTPVLSPKKTWEGLAGGLALAALTAVLINRSLPVPALRDDLAAAGLGLTVGVAGVLGDLAESLIKRDCRQKDASQVVPGFGGVLDVIDSIVFAAPVAYWWLRG
jgi:phosphatidate cytidylyltransferase